MSDMVLSPTASETVARDVAAAHARAISNFIAFARAQREAAMCPPGHRHEAAAWDSAVAWFIAAGYRGTR
jgi:hypothetical protein